ncbi:MAG: hypothetical protein FH749_14225 [Firmicutes bacterium]|nr:hypothetical protein [Bacillota bacterium]
MVSLLSLLFSLILIYSFSFIRRGAARYYYTLFFLLWASVNGLIFTGDLFNTIVFIEISSVAIYALIAWSQTDEALEIVFKYMLVGTIGTSFIILSTAILYAAAGSLSITHLAGLIPELPLRIQVITIILYIFGFGAKVALIPVNAWLADAHAFAPTPISALISAGFMKVLLYVFFRIAYSVYGWELLSALNIDKLLLYFGASTALIGAFLAMGQQDLKRILAYSTITQLGFIIMAFSLGTIDSLVAGIYHLLNHGVVKGTLFLAVGVLEQQTGSTSLEKLRGIGPRLPVAFMCFGIGALALRC